MTYRSDDETRRNDVATTLSALSTPPTERIGGSLAWSQEDPTDDLLPYDDGDAYAAEPGEWLPVEPRWWQRLPVLAFGAAAAALVAVGGVAVALTSSSHAPVSAPISHPPSHPSQAPSVAPPPPVSAVTPPTEQSRPVVTVTRDRPASPRPHATATASATSAAPPPPVATSVAPPPPELATPTPQTPTAPPMTTAYLSLPFVPVPIPIQVPSNPNQPPQYQQPQYQQPEYPYQQGPYGRYRQ
jgi:hypothetical protein